MPAVTCMLCRPPEAVGDGLMDHLRLFHPDMYETVAASAGGLAGPPVPDPDPGAAFDHPVMTEADLEPHGCRCGDCGCLFKPGDRYASRLIGMVGSIPMTEVVCVPCGEVSP